MQGLTKTDDPDSVMFENQDLVIVNIRLIVDVNCKEIGDSLVGCPWLACDHEFPATKVLGPDNSHFWVPYRIMHSVLKTESQVAGQCLVPGHLGSAKPPSLA
ncbi:hypothetical protein QYF36_013581 [Acer negundo]|nr:hypothetical protein QYF36_013581 [Acer negundo]